MSKYVKLEDVIRVINAHSYVIPEDAVNHIFDRINSLPSIDEEWVSVDDRLPSHGEDYNVVLDLNDNMGPPVSGIMEFDGINKEWNYPGTDVICDCVTHWQPLPQPPPTINKKL